MINKNGNRKIKRKRNEGVLAVEWRAQADLCKLIDIRDTSIGYVMQNTNAYVYICIVLYIYIYIHVELAESSTSCIYRRDIYRLIVSEEKVVCGVHFFFLVVGKSLKACLVALQSINHSIN